MSCDKCLGLSEKMYANTNTWRKGGISGCAITKGVCDSCWWGTGSSRRTGINLQVLSDMLDIIEDPSADKDDVLMASHTIRGMF